MAIQVRFTSSPIASIRDGVVCVLPMRDVIPPRDFTGGLLGDILRAWNQYGDEIKATGRAAATSCYARQGTGRKPAGFDKATRTRYINTENAPADDNELVTA